MRTAGLLDSQYIRYKLWLMNHMRIDLRVRSFSHKQFRSGTNFIKPIN